MFLDVREMGHLVPRHIFMFEKVICWTKQECCCIARKASDVRLVTEVSVGELQCGMELVYGADTAGSEVVSGTTEV